MENGHAALARRHRDGTEPHSNGARDAQSALAGHLGDGERLAHHEITAAVMEFVKDAFTRLPHTGERSTTIIQCTARSR